MLAERLKDRSHSQLAAQGVTVGPHVTGENHPRGLLQNFQKTCPIESHHTSLETLRCHGNLCGLTDINGQLRLQLAHAGEFLSVTQPLKEVNVDVFVVEIA